MSEPTEELKGNEPKREKVRIIPVELIDNFPDHPFQVKDDESMAQLVSSIEMNGVLNPVILRKKEGKLDTDAINTIMNEEKPNQKARIKIPMEKIEKYFPVGTSEQKIEETIIKALAMYRQRQKENRDAR